MRGFQPGRQKESGAQAHGGLGLAAFRKRKDDVDRAAGYADGGRVKPRGFVAGPGTESSDSIPARLSDGEYVLPADTVQAVGVDHLDALREATHDPARGFSGKEEGEFFFAGGGAVDDDETLNNLTRSRDTYPVGSQGYVGVDRMVQQRQGQIDTGNNIRAVFGPGQTQPQSSLNDPVAQAATAPAIGRPPGVAPAPSGFQDPAPMPAMDFGARGFGVAPSQAATSPTQAPSAQPAVPGATQIMPGVYRRGNSYGDSPEAAGLGFGARKVPTANEIAAADAIAERSAQQVATMGVRQPFGFQPAQAPRIGGDDFRWMTDIRDPRYLALRSAAMDAESEAYQANRGKSYTVDRSGRARGMVAPDYSVRDAMMKTMMGVPEQNMAASLKTDGTNAGLQSTSMQQAGANQRAGMQEAGSNQRAADRNALDGRKLDLDAQAKGFDIRLAQRREGILHRYDTAKSDEERAAMVKRFPEVFGKRDDTADWAVQVTPAQKNPDGSTSEGSIYRYNKRTGDVQRVEGGAEGFENDPRAIAIKNDKSMTLDQKKAALKALGWG